MAARKPKICFDRVLPEDMARPQAKRRAGGAMRAVFEFRKMWMNGTTLRVRFLGGTPQQQAKVKAEGVIWTQFANLNFEFNNAADAEIRISFNEDDGAWSYVGTDCTGIPRNQATMNLGFMDPGVVAHEFGHAIGLGHEHQNPKGGIEWNEPAVIKDLGGPPNSWSPEETRHNVLNKYTVDQIRGTQFDPDSIMLYAFPAKWTLNGIATKSNKSLSALDRSFIASVEAYPGRNATTPLPGPVVLAVNAAKATSAAIGVPGEEDAYTFNAATAAKYVIETTGATDVVMKLFGPNSQTALLAEDDDSGAGTNARIQRDLIPGKYFIQIRHFNKQGGTGSYKIQVKK
ncbi:MAG: M12 family metallopeptidase [Blastocatellia bacterium]